MDYKSELMWQEIYDVWAFDILLNAYVKQTGKDEFFCEELNEFANEVSNKSVASAFDEIKKMERAIIISSNVKETLGVLVQMAKESLTKNQTLNISRSLSSIVKQHKFIQKLGRKSNGVGSYPYYKYDINGMKSELIKNKNCIKLTEQLKIENTSEPSKRNSMITTTISEINSKIRKYKRRKAEYI